MNRWFSFSERIAHIIEKYIAQMQVGVVGWVHYHAMVILLQLVLSNMVFIYDGADSKHKFTGFRRIVRKQLAQACHDQVTLMGIVRDLEFLFRFFLW